MDDNAWPHRTLTVEELLESEYITRMDWPAYSLYLNPIEHEWGALGRRIAARVHHSENTQQLKQMLIEEWALLPQEMLHQLVLSMRRRCEATIAKDTFGDRLISRFGPVNWPPRTCDLTPLDYFLWGYVKSLVYADKPQTLDHLEDNIRRVIADIRPQMLEKVIENWTSRLDYIRASRGSPMP
ncbi:retrovirus-related Pol polyprotein from transposon TNT 1-94 [Trichonephila clavipes]|nr:retrovirus-related Pol polyprotein from transposon TNT 1-94 [Trichonephila clavipes]